LIGLNAETASSREAATAGTNAHTIFGRENHFRIKCALTEKADVQESYIHWQRKAFIKGI
jgi:hypothetical protein